MKRKKCRKRKLFPSKVSRNQPKREVREEAGITNSHNLKGLKVDVLTQMERVRSIQKFNSHRTVNFIIFHLKSWITSDTITINFAWFSHYSCLNAKCKFILFLVSFQFSTFFLPQCVRTVTFKNNIFRNSW